MKWTRRGLGALGVGYLAGGLSTPARAEAPPPFAYEEHLLASVRVHLLRARTVEDLDTRLKLADVERIFGKINRLVWSQGGMQILVESVVDEQARAQDLLAGLGANRTEDHLLLARPKDTLTDTMLHVYYIHEMDPNGIYMGPQAIFVKDTAELRSVSGGLDEPLPRVTAHEIGHAFGLPHRQDGTNLMQSGANGYSLNAAEVERAREVALKLPGTLTVQTALAAAEKAFAAKEWAPARRIFRALEQVPGTSATKTAAMARLAEIPKPS